METSLRFYRDLLGMEIWFDMKDDNPILQSVTEITGAHIWMIKLKAKDGVSIELLQYLSHPQGLPSPSRSCDVGCNHIALQVDDIDSLYEKLKSGGNPVPRSAYSFARRGRQDDLLPRSRGGHRRTGRDLRLKHFPRKLS